MQPAETLRFIPTMQKPHVQELLRRFASTISKGPLGFVDHAPESWASPMLSLKNILQKLESDGGRAILRLGISRPGIPSMWSLPDRHASRHLEC
jgi:hypothetical protein